MTTRVTSAIFKVPDVTFRTRIRDERIDCGPDSPTCWSDKTTGDYFSGVRSIAFSLPGAFTPTCSTFQLPGFEKLFPEFQSNGIERIYCISVNDAFVMNAWAKDQGLKNVQVIPDGSGTFTRLMGMLVDKDNLGFGMRSWRYAMIVDDCEIKSFWAEDGIRDNADNVPYGETSPENILEAVKEMKL